MAVPRHSHICGTVMSYETSECDIISFKIEGKVPTPQYKPFFLFFFNLPFLPPKASEFNLGLYFKKDSYS